MQKLGERRKSIQDLLTTTKRKSFFETSQELEPKDETSESSWQQRWGHLNHDFVNVISYPDEFIQDIKEEKDAWLSGFREMLQKADKIADKRSCTQIITSCELPTEQNAFLAHAESKIEQFLETATSFGRDIEVEACSKLRMDQHNDLKLMEKLMTSK